MRRFDKKQNIQKANLIVEQRYLESKGLIKEGETPPPMPPPLPPKLPPPLPGGKGVNEDGNTKLSPQEQEVYNDIISEMDVLNEGSFSNILNKVKRYTKEGLLTAGILAALLATPGITNAQSSAINNVANVEAGVNSNNEVNVDLFNTVRKHLKTDLDKAVEWAKEHPNSAVANMISDFSNGGGDGLSDSNIYKLQSDVENTNDFNKFMGDYAGSRDFWG